MKYQTATDPCKVFKSSEHSPRAVFRFASDAADFVRIANAHDDLVAALQELVDNGGIGPEDMFDRARDALAKVKERK